MLQSSLGTSSLPFRQLLGSNRRDIVRSVTPLSCGWSSSGGGGGLSHRRLSTVPAGRRQVRCAARLTSSRDSLDEEQAEVLLPQAQQNGVPGAVAAVAAGNRAQPKAPGTASSQQQQANGVDEAPACEDAWQARQLSSKQLQQLTELHADDAYSGGLVSCAAELAACLSTHLADGLCESQDELEQRARRYGSNTVRPPKEVTLLELIVEALQDFTILVLLGAGALSLALEAVVQRTSGADEGSWIEGASILAAVCVVVLVTAVNNYQKERQFRLLQAVSADVKVRVLRHGREQALPVAQVLVGDLLLVETGDILCTDGLLVAGADVKVDESHLTGESDDVAKDPVTRPSLLGGSKILSGFGRMLVTAVGPFSQSGAIAEMVADGKGGAAAATAAAAAATAGGGADGMREETLLQQKLAQYATTIGQFGLGAASLATVAMTVRFSVDTFLLQQQPWSWDFLQDYLRFFITGVTILVVAVPEGLPLAVTLALAFSVRRMLDDQNLVRHLSAAETMGTANVVCSDKTGTLTQNEMVVSKLWLAGHTTQDLKPYTRHESVSGGEKTRRSWLASSGTASSASLDRASSRDDGYASSAVENLPPLAQLLASPDSGREPDGADPSSGGHVDDVVSLLVESVALNSTANIIVDGEGIKRSIGNRTEVALLELAALLGCDLGSMRAQHSQLAQVAFSSDRKRMTTAVLAPCVGTGTDGSSLCRVFTKGATELVLDRCTHVLAPDGSRRLLREDERQQLLGDFSQGGQRVLCMAYRDIHIPSAALRANGGGEQAGAAAAAGDGSMVGCDPRGYQWDTSSSVNAWMSSSSSSSSSNGEQQACLWDSDACLADNLESNLTLLALVGIEDPLRPEVPAAIKQCQASGITVKMLTGDNVGTATAIAREAGILPPAGTSLQHWLAATAALAGTPPAALQGYHSAASASLDGAAAGAHGEASGHVDHLPPGVVMEGPEFRQRVLNEDGSIKEEEFLALWPTLRVLARCSPADKYTIVTGVRSLTRDVVAVTGDGTNDAPALRAANVGFAMNVGTDTAKEAADIVLLDNNFASIVSAVLWGRNVYANITRFLQFQLTVNLVAVAVAVTGAVVATESPLTAVQMLWVNMIMDSLASLALATEPPDARILSLPPYSREHEFVDPAAPAVKHILGQASYQLVVMLGLIFYAPALLGIPDHSEVLGPSVHYTLVFNTFVFMQLFNQLNARKILDNTNVWEGLGDSPWFQWILGSELALQILIVQFGGRWFSTQPLDAREWAVCVGLGAFTLVLREVLIRLPFGSSEARAS